MRSIFKCDCITECTLLEVDDFERDKEWGILGLNFYVIPRIESLYEKIVLAMKVLRWGSALQNSIILKKEDFERFKKFINDIEIDAKEEEVFIEENKV